MCNQLAARERGRKGETDRERASERANEGGSEIERQRGRATERVTETLQVVTLLGVVYSRHTSLIGLLQRCGADVHAPECLGRW